MGDCGKEEEGKKKAVLIIICSRLLESKKSPVSTESTHTHTHTHTPQSEHNLHIKTKSKTCIKQVTLFVYITVHFNLIES